MTLILKDTIKNVTFEDLNYCSVLHVDKCLEISRLVELLSINTTSITIYRLCNRTT